MTLFGILLLTSVDEKKRLHLSCWHIKNFTKPEWKIKKRLKMKKSLSGGSPRALAGSGGNNINHARKRAYQTGRLMPDTRAHSPSIAISTEVKS